MINTMIFSLFVVVGRDDITRSLFFGGVGGLEGRSFFFFLPPKRVNREGKRFVKKKGEGEGGRKKNIKRKERGRGFEIKGCPNPPLPPLPPTPAGILANVLFVS